MDQPSNGNNPSDAESMLASALLEIRSDTRGEVHNPGTIAAAPTLPHQHILPTAALTVAPPPVVQAPAKRRPSARKNKAASVAENNPIAPSVAPPLPQAPPSAPPMPPGALPFAAPPGSMFSPEQVAALRVAAAASAASLAAAAGASATPNPLAPPAPDSLHQQLGLFQHAAALSGSAPPPAAGFQQQALAAAAAARAVAPVVPPVVPPGVPPVVPAMAVPHVGVVEQDPPTLVAAGPPDTIRREHVEAALKSKPQRGRKREDLSELERLELTRTRNREHAKSTRIRKKARHQELLDIEKKYELMEKSFSLRTKRQTVLGEFLRVREYMLHNFTARSSDGSLSSGEYTAPMGNKTLSSPWEELVENTNDFLFDEGWKHDDGPMLSAAERMHRFDEYVYSGVTSKFGNAMISMLRYNFKGESDGIALDFSNSGLAELELSLALPNKVLLMTGIVRFRFEPNSAKLRSIAYVSSMDHLASSERLNAQISFPSTVSLDPPAALGDPTKGTATGEAKDDAPGPGMSI